MGELGFEGTQPTEASILADQLKQEAASVLNLDKTTPEFRARILKLMGDLEQSRDKLGPYCSTVGEGEDRVVIMAGTKTEDVISKLRPGDYGGGNLSDQVSMVANLREHLVVNNAGVYSIASVSDRIVSPEDEARLKEISGDGINGMEQRAREAVHAFVNKFRGPTQYSGVEAERLLGEVMASGKYPEMSPKTPIPGSGETWTNEQWRDYDTKSNLWSLGQYTLSPKWRHQVADNTQPFSFNAPRKKEVAPELDLPTDREFHNILENVGSIDYIGPGGGHSGFYSWRITQPETVSELIDTSVRESMSKQTGASPNQT